MFPCPSMHVSGHLSPADIMARTNALQHAANAAGVATHHAPYSALRKFYYPDTLDWKELVIARGQQVIQQALCGLAQESEV